MDDLLPVGKVDYRLLRDLLKELPTDHPDLVIPPGIGYDAAGIKNNSNLIAVACDPITFTVDRIGTYSVSVNLNDIACMGCRPKWYSSNLLLPQGTTALQLREIWTDLCKALRKYNVHAVSGHTEVTPAVNQAILSGHVIGEAIENRFLNPEDAKPGDELFLWQGAALEGTAILANERYDELIPFLGKEKLNRMAKFIDDPGICVWPFVEKLLPNPSIVALHDPTEGGICTAIHEVLDASKLGVEIDGDAIPILPETKELSYILRFNPLGLLASGSLLIIAKPDANLNLPKIGTLTDKKERLIKRGGAPSKLPFFLQDELISALTREMPM